MAEVAGDWVLLEFPSRPENVAFARTAAALFASRLPFTLDELEDLKVAVSEAVSNAVIHAYPSDRPGLVRVRLAIAEGQVEVEVEDQGRGIADVEQALEPTFTTRPQERMGLGLSFVRAYTDEMRLTSRPGGPTRLWMRKRPAGTQAAPPRPEADAPARG